MLLIRILPHIYELNLLVIKPRDPLSMLPESESHLAALRVFIHPEPMLFAFEEPPLVFPVVLPSIKAIPGLFVELKLSFVDLAIGVVINAHTMHKIVVPPPVIFPAVVEVVLAKALNFVGYPVALVSCAIGPLVGSFAPAFTFKVLSFILIAFRPHFYPIT